MFQFKSAIVLSLAFLVMIGCQQQSESKTGAAPDATGTVTGTQSETTSTAATGNSSARRQNERWTDANGVEYLGNVPLDIFYDRPLKIVMDNAAVSSTSPAADGAAETMVAADPPEDMATEPMDATTDSPATAAGWDEMIPVETLLNEINQIRNSLTQSLQSVGSYKRSMLMIPPQAATLAVLAGVAMEHPSEITWRDDAKYIRDLARQMNEDTLAPSKKDQTRLQILFENIVNTLNRSRPADLPEPDPELSFVDVAEMGHLMVRIDQAEKKLKTEAGTESAFGSKKDMIKHEAAILGTMTHVATLEGYGYFDDEEFLGYAKQVTDAAQRIRDSVDTGDFNGYELALTKVSTGCQSCHLVYRN